MSLFRLVDTESTWAPEHQSTIASTSTLTTASKRCTILIGVRRDLQSGAGIELPWLCAGGSMVTSYESWGHDWGLYEQQIRICTFPIANICDYGGECEKKGGA